MNDLELKKQLKDAFDSVKMPQDLRDRTLAAASSAPSVVKVANTPKSETAESYADAAKAIKPRPMRAKNRTLRFACGIAACLAIALVGAFGYRYMTEPTAFIDIDVNPSIELAVNRFDSVVHAEALNDDARTVLNRTDIIGKPYVDAAETLISALRREGYDLDEAYLEFSISSDDARQTAALESSTDSLITACGYAGRCNVVDKSTHEAAHACNMGAGKYLAAQELSRLDPSITMEECSHMSMRQIRDSINACHSKANSNTESDNDSGTQGAHHGQGHGYRHHYE